MQDLKVTLIQRELAWESPGDNRDHIAASLAEHSGDTDLVVLPEMFTTGFSMNALANAEAEIAELRRIQTEHIETSQRQQVDFDEKAQALKTEMLELRQSWSWRLTAPLRATLGRLLEGGRKPS